MDETLGDVYTTGEAAHALDRSSEQVRRYASTGMLRALRTQRGYRLFTKRDVDALKRRLDVQRETRSAR